MSIQEDWNDPEPAKPAKKPMSTGMKVLLIVGGIGGALLLLCCGGGVIVYYKFIKDAYSTDPNVVRTRTAEIAPIEIPADFSPMQTVGFGPMMRMVMYQKNIASGSPSMLMLMEMGQQMAQGATPEQQREQMLQGMRQQQQQTGMAGNVNVAERDSRKLTIKGQQADFDFIKGKDQQGAVVRQVVGTFPTSRGVGMLMLMVPDAEYDEDAVVKMIESIGDPGQKLTVSEKGSPPEKGEVEQSDTEQSDTDNEGKAPKEGEESTNGG